MIDFDENNIQSASIDLRLSEYYRTQRVDQLMEPVSLSTDPDLIWTKPIKFNSLIVRPFDLVLLSSVEYVDIPLDMSATIYSRSSSGRIGFEHLHSGFGDPGFKGTWTFEFINLLKRPIIVRPGDKLVQMVVTKLDETTVKPYKGKYQFQQLPMPFYQR